jgi:hypothetical protein
MLFPNEQEAVKTVIAAGKDYGYGNMIAHLKRAWAESLLDSGLQEESALAAANVSAYPLRTEKCICGKRATHISVDSEIGPDLMCFACSQKWIALGNVNEATVWEVQEI